MNDFPDIIRELPNADIPIQGLHSYLFQGETKQIVFMIFENDAEVTEHSHEAQWGIVLEGKMILKMDNIESTLRKGDEYYIPKGKKHSAKIMAGYRDVTLFDQKDRYNISPKGGN